MDSAYCGLTYQYQSLSQDIGSACEALHSCSGTDPLTCMRAITAEQAYACGPAFLMATGHLPAHMDSEVFPSPPPPPPHPIHAPITSHGCPRSHPLADCLCRPQATRKL